ncbi:hypothetical protein [uncultured Aquimarina sp.]|uniref:FEKKY domain-containing protein n=1 Tax=uncultured Aquimarina sp. TaxID=575652 RepID=UPI002625D6BF|nr:hypothetical protein [uncultured Aquimarina sp.]
MYKIIFLTLFFSIYVEAQQDFNNSECTLYGDVISRTSAYKHIREGQPTLLITGIITEKRAIYIAKAYRDFSNKLDSSSVDSSFSNQLKQNFIIPLSTTEKKYHFRFKEIGGCFLPKCITNDSVKSYNNVMKDFLTRKYGNSWKRNEFNFKF